MKKYVVWKNLGRVGAAIAVVSMASAPHAFASPSNGIVLELPADLPSLARQGGDAMLLRDTADGRTLLFVEQNDGAQLAVFDVTAPAHIKGEGSVPLDVPGSFDFVAGLGQKIELVRFRDGQGEAVLDFQKATRPTLVRMEPSKSDNSIKWVGSDRSLDSTTAASLPVLGAPAVRDYRVVEAGGKSKAPAQVVDVKQVRDEVTNPGTGTTFLSTDHGLFLVRRPALEIAEPSYLNSGG
jgi:hypothetical protein